MCVHTRQLVSDYAGITIRNYFKEDISFADAVEVILQVSRALQRLSKNGFAHNDIKDDNVCVLDEEKGPVATVIDLGQATRIGGPGPYSYHSHPEHYPWNAPELLLRNPEPCSEASEAYSLAFMIMRLFPLLDEQALPPSLDAWV